MKRFLLVTILVVVGGLSLFVFWKYFYVFGSGVKSGHLNYLVHKGDLFKTYEGKLIQEGIRSRTAGSVQSYEFEFSVANKRIAEQMMQNSGKWFDLQYKEYHGVASWRGNTRYIVDSILTMRDDK